MQFLFAMRLKQDVAPVTSEQREMEISYVKEMYAADAIRQIWSRVDTAGACLLIEAASVSAALELIEDLPLMKAGKLEVETFVPLQSYKGFAASGK